MRRGTTTYRGSKRAAVRQPRREAGPDPPLTVLKEINPAARLDLGPPASRAMSKQASVGAPSLWYLVRAAPVDTGREGSVLVGPGPRLGKLGHTPRRWKLNEVYRETNHLAAFSEVLSGCPKERLSLPADGHLPGRCRCSGDNLGATGWSRGGAMRVSPGHAGKRAIGGAAGQAVAGSPLSRSRAAPTRC